MPQTPARLSFFRHKVGRSLKEGPPRTKSQKGVVLPLPAVCTSHHPPPCCMHRSGIYFHTPEQRETAIKSKDKMQASMKDLIVTEIEPVTKYSAAENYHQQYLASECAHSGSGWVRGCAGWPARQPLFLLVPALNLYCQTCCMQSLLHPPAPPPPQVASTHVHTHTSLHARAHARTHALTCARTHARTHTLLQMAGAAAAHRARQRGAPTPSGATGEAPELGA